MNARPGPICLLALLLAACAPPASGSGEVARADGELALVSSAHPVDSGRAWVVFTDRGVFEGPDRAAAALQALERELPPKAVARRRAAGIAATAATGGEAPGRATTRRDLPVDPAYVDAVAALGLRTRHVSRRLNAVSVDAVDGALHDLLDLPFVHDVLPVAQRARTALPEPSATVAPPASTERGGPPLSPYDYGAGLAQAQRVSAPLLHAHGFDGTGVVVAVTDTGFHFQNEVLSPLLDQVVAAYDFVQDDDVVDDEAGDPPSQAFHGSVILSVLAGSADGVLVGIAPEVSLLLAKTEHYTDEEPAEEDDWIAGVEWAELQGADLLTSSLGWSDWYDPHDMDGNTATSTVFIEDLVATTGLPVFVAAGNRGPSPGSLVAPADAASVLSIGATEAASTPAGFSGRGPTADGRVKPDLAAPGVNLTVARWDEDEGVESQSGTSVATPLLAGLAALILQADPARGREALFDSLRASADNADAPNNDIGAGVPDGWLACGLHCSCVDEDGDGAFAEACGGDDCADDDPERNPDADELCNGVDDDCSGLLLPGEVDGDGDGDRPCATDCDDADPTVEGLDHDGDGVSLCDGDCADGDPARAPGMEEVPYDGIDQDCDGSDERDADGDGYAGGPGGADCFDNDPATYPDPWEGGWDDPLVDLPTEGGHELCFDGRDNDCDGLLDRADPDCDRSSLVDPGATSTTTTVVATGCSQSLSRGAGGATVRTGALSVALALVVPLVAGSMARRRRRRASVRPLQPASAQTTPFRA